MGSAPLRSRAIALVAALCMMLFLFILAMAFQTILSSDIHYGAKQRADVEAFFLVKSGMEYYANKGLPADPIHVPWDDPRHFCAITYDSGTGNVIFRGTVTAGPGVVLSEQVVVAPAGDLSRWYEQ